MTYQTRSAKIQLTLQDGATFDGDKGNVLTIDNARMEAQLSFTGGFTGALATIKIYGLGIGYMSILAGRGVQLDANRQKFLIRLDVNNVEVFLGFANWCYIDANAQPEMALVVQAAAQGEINLMTIPDTHISSKTTVADAARKITANTNMVINDYTNYTLPSVYTTGSVGSQLIQLMQATLKVYPKFQYSLNYSYLDLFTLDNALDYEIINISKDTGMIGYPSFTQTGISLTTLFNPKFSLQRIINLKSDLPNISGKYQIIDGCTANLSTVIDNGPWTSTIACMYMENQK